MIPHILALYFLILQTYVLMRKSSLLKQLNKDTVW